MDGKAHLWLLVLIVCTNFGMAGKTAAQSVMRTPQEDDVADVPCKEFFVEGDTNRRYFLIGDGEQIEAPEEGFKLVIVLSGGDGGAGYNSFVKRIYKYSLSPKYLMAQLVAVKWTPDQQIVWPTNNDRVNGQKFSTEEFVEAVVKDIKAKYKLNQQHIFTLAWSSASPAAYAVSLQKEKSITGSYIAMSVFKPDTLGSLENAAGHCYFFDHSPDDKVCPIQMAKKANEMLSEIGARTRFVTYKGGHGWHGNCYGRLEWGFGWLERTAQAQDRRQESMQTRSRQSRRLKFPIVEGFETGSTVPTGWQKGARVKGVKYIWDRNTAFKGKASLCLKKTAKRFFPIAQWFKGFAYDEKFQQLQVSAQVKAERAAKAIIDVQFYTADRKLLGHKWAVYIGAKEPTDPPADHDWKQYSGTVSILEGTEIVVIALQIYGPGAVWFDELTADYVKPEGKK